MLSEVDLDSRFRNEFGHVVDASHIGFGYWLWKPQAVLQIARSLPSGTLVVYMDLGCHIYPWMKFDWRPVMELCTISASSVVGFQDRKKDPVLLGGSAEAAWTKGDLFDYFDVRSDKNVYKTPQYAATSFILKVDDRSLKFLEDWVAVARHDLGLFDDSPSTNPNFLEFREHRYDQSVFSILCKIRGCSRLPQDLLQARRFKASDSPIRFLPWVAARDLTGFPRHLIVWGKAILRLLLNLVLPRRDESESSRIKAAKC